MVCIFLKKTSHKKIPYLTPFRDTTNLRSSASHSASCLGQPHGEWGEDVVARETSWMFCKDYINLKYVGATAVKWILVWKPQYCTFVSKLEFVLASEM